MASATDMLCHIIFSILPLIALGKRDRPSNNNYPDDKYDDDNDNAAASNGEDDSEGLGTGLVVAIVACSVVVLIIIVLLIVLFVVRSRRRAEGHQRMQDPETQVRNRPPSAADLNAFPQKPGQPLVGPVKPPSYTGPQQGHDNRAADGDDHTYEDPDALRQGVPPPTYTFALRDGAQYPRIPSELGREIKGN